MGLLSREEIINVVDIQFEDVEVPEWGGTVRVRGLNGMERDEFEKSIIDIQGRGKRQTSRVNLSNIRAKLVSLAVCDEDGKRVFTNSDVKMLGSKSASALDRVFAVAQRLSGITDEDVEELEKNSSEVQSEDSTSD